MPELKLSDGFFTATGFQVGFTNEGKLVALSADLYSNAGNTLDLSGSIMDRALLHIDNCYKIPNLRAVGHVCRTNQATNTAFRGFGGPQVTRPATPLQRFDRLGFPRRCPS